MEGHPLTGRARARRLCQAAIGVFIDPQKTIYDFAREEVGEQFDRYFPDPTSPAQRLLSSIIKNFRSAGLEDDEGEHLANVATQLFAGHGLTSTELAGMAKAEIGVWATDAASLVCGRGLTTRPLGMGVTLASGSETLRVEVDPAIEGQIRALVEAFYARLIPLTLGSDLRGAIDGYQSELLREIAGKLDGLTRPPEAPKPFTIPAPVGDFKGYEKELADVRAALSGVGAAAISVVHGMGGVGKSELALKVAQEMVAAFPDGQILVDMLGTTQPRSAAEAMTDVLLALGVEAVSPNEREAEYQRHLRGKRLLILLDNVAGRTRLDALRPPPPGALLVTSRTRLALAGVPSIALERLAPDAAGALLSEIVQALDEASCNALVELCCGLPLALRVAGAYLQETGASPAAYIAALRQRRLDHLARSAGDIERPDLDPRVVLGLSYDRLEAELSRSFKRLSVFPADFDAAAAAATLDLISDEAERHLGLLYRRSLVQRPTEGRFRLHDLLRELANTELDAADGSLVRQRFRDHFMAVLEHYEPRTWLTAWQERGAGFESGLNNINPTFSIELDSICYALCLLLVDSFDLAYKSLEKLCKIEVGSFPPGNTAHNMLPRLERAAALLPRQDRELALARGLAILGGRDPARMAQERANPSRHSQSALTARAIELYRGLIGANPTLSVELARCLEQEGRLDEAAILHADLARLDHARFGTTLRESVQRYSYHIFRVMVSGTGQLGDVVTVLRQVVERSPSSSATWLAERLTWLASVAASDQCRVDTGTIAADLQSLAEQLRQQRKREGDY